jgi:phage shock protein C
VNINDRRLYRCTHDRKIAGVAAGMAEYLDIDPTVMRVAWVLATLIGGFTIPLYVILWFVMPNEPALAPSPTSVDAPADAAAVPDAGDPAAATPGVATPASPAPAFAAAPAGHEHRHRVTGGDRHPGMFFGILLVVFGGLALVGPAFPGWVSAIHLGPAFILALGIALVVSAARRTPQGS